MKRRPIEQSSLKFFKLVLDPHDRLWEGHLSLEERSLDFSRGEAKLQCLGPDPECHRENTVRVSKKCCVKDSVPHFKRDDRIRHPLETPVRDK
jgi:hypothetical protein